MFYSKKGSLGNFFKNYIKSESIFKNKKILQASYMPETIIHREQEIGAIAGMLAPSLKGDLPSNVFIYGKTGTGKTLALSHIKSEILKVANESRISLDMLYINCKLKKSTDTEYRLIAELARMLGREVPTTGLPTAEIYDNFISAVENHYNNSKLCIKQASQLIGEAKNLNSKITSDGSHNFYFKTIIEECEDIQGEMETLNSRLQEKPDGKYYHKVYGLCSDIFEHIEDILTILREDDICVNIIEKSLINPDKSIFNPTGQTLILILDEIDQLVGKIGDEILYTLTRLNADLKNSQISIVGISNDMTFADNLEPRVRSSLNEEDLVFAPYNAIQLQEILHARTIVSFNEGVIDGGVIAKCAAYAARDHGDARRALDLLRVAGEIADRSNMENVTIDHIDEAEKKIEKDRVMDIVKSQPKQSQAVLYSILSVTGSDEHFYTGDIYNTYTHVCSKSALRPLTMRRISDIIAELDTLGIINAQVMSKGRQGRTRKISSSLPKSLTGKLKEVLESSLGFS